MDREDPTLSTNLDRLAAEFDGLQRDYPSMRGMHQSGGWGKLLDGSGEAPPWYLAGAPDDACWEFRDLASNGAALAGVGLAQAPDAWIEWLNLLLVRRKFSGYSLEAGSGAARSNEAIGLREHLVIRNVCDASRALCTALKRLERGGDPYALLAGRADSRSLSRVRGGAATADQTIAFRPASAALTPNQALWREAERCVSLAAGPGGPFKLKQRDVYKLAYPRGADRRCTQIRDWLRFDEEGRANDCGPHTTPHRKIKAALEMIKKDPSVVTGQ